MLDAIRKRRSVRQYKSDPVSEEDLKQICEAAFSAPTANNQRPWHLIVITEQATRDAMSQVHQWAGFCAQAPVVMVMCGDEKLADHWWIDDCSAATENAMIQAAELGLGTCWIGLRGGGNRDRGREEMVSKLLGLPSNIRVLCAFSLGYPASEGSNRGPGPMDNVHRERW
jgi:nitroreductase